MDIRRWRFYEDAVLFGVILVLLIATVFLLPT